MKKTILIEIIASLFVLLFTYTAISKFIGFKTFFWDLGRDPLLEKYAKLIAIGIPIIEILVSICLLLPKLRKLGLWFSFSLMTVFTGYIAYVLKYMDEVRHCTCGGFIRQMTWHQHLWFNISLVCLAAWAIILERNSELKNVYNIQTTN